MRSIRRPVLAAAALTAVVALTATGCGPEGNQADGKPSQSADQGSAGGGGFTIPKDIQDKLKEHGVDLDKWKNGEWKNWDKDKWLREASEFINPIIKGLWDPDRASKAKPPKEPTPKDISGDQGRTDPEPRPVQAKAVKPPFGRNAPGLGKIFFDTPEGHAVCSGAVVKDPAHPGKSNLVWTAGHCVHAGKSGGWYRNMIFAPSFNDSGKPAAQLERATREEMFPKGVWWADGASTSNQWISQGGPQGNSVPMAPYDFAIMHVTPEKGAGNKSLEEVAGGAYSVDFNASAIPDISSITAQGYPAEAPFDGSSLQQCTDKPGRLSLAAQKPTMYRIGCLMTAGSSGGPWFAKGSDGKPVLVSNTSIGPRPAGWLAGPHLGPEAKSMYGAMSKKFASQ
ncbi:MULTISPECIES: trypsin-like serine peptidase [Streptomyces]|uniref:V8-like Glu-specific endopeptidase n=2 Tax=Streptomyces rimosus subsp. rimosus TaxID=132474 RepID=L8EMB1_STRR1|nr:MULTISPECIES: hypothetical protein [Streptomyces]KOG68229.1 hypothetical protein ADK78_37910 [Kitasatospora aureofaciens]MYT44790.1 hypothetical protein [Streptomyces sp. SID5471]KEF18071.1 hypothetical protein DF18_25735 [Streptomyces rimosus]KOT26327.1 hypothetical protein ADK84_40970 [Streptomyces sp. NRRL WC-3701]KOT26937.1 hypothetical protein ADK42_37635 [Streptomyces rimosus subsp. rimosus]